MTTNFPRILEVDAFGFIETLENVGHKMPCGRAAVTAPAKAGLASAFQPCLNKDRIHEFGFDKSSAYFSCAWISARQGPKSNRGVTMY